MRRYAGFSRKREPALWGRRAPFSGVVISNVTASPPLILLSIGNFSDSAPILTSGIFVSSGDGLSGWRQQEICMKERIDRHKDGSIKAKGHMKDGELEGYWEWFRKDGSKMRSGYFVDGKQVGEWTTYDAKGKVVKVTKFSR
jgi:hypothetical protein